MPNNDPLQPGMDPGLKKTLGISFVFHAILLLVFYFTTIGVSIDLPEFVEVSFVQAAEAPKKTKTQQRAPVQKVTQSEPQQKEADPPAIVPVKVDLPKRRMLETEPPQLQARDVEKQMPQESGSGITPQQMARNGDRDRFTPEASVQAGKEGFQPDDSFTDLDGEAQSTPGFQSSSFEIEGKAAERKILFKVLPSYPEGYNKDGIIKFRFKLLANGHVVEIIPTVKNDAVLEQNARSVFTQWQFSALPNSAPQDPVEGIITFRYKLK